MTDFKSKLDEHIRNSVAQGDTLNEAARRVFCFNSSAVLESNTNEGFSILNKVSKHFSVPFRSIYIAGSAQTGYSYFKEREFIPNESDLDLAIVDMNLFRKFSEIVYGITKGYNDLTKFGAKDGVSQASGFQSYIVKGYFRPDLMPNCRCKQDWFAFFNRLSREHSGLFENINCGIYFSECFFEGKQIPTINKIKREIL